MGVGANSPVYSSRTVGESSPAVHSTSRGVWTLCGTRMRLHFRESVKCIAPVHVRRRLCARVPRLAALGVALAAACALTACVAVEDVTPTCPFLACSQPISVTASSPTGLATVMWGPLSGASSYTVYYSTDPAFKQQNLQHATASNSPLTITGLTSGGTYYVEVAGMINGVASAVPAIAAVGAPEFVFDPSFGTGTGIITRTGTLGGSTDRFNGLAFDSQGNLVLSGYLTDAVSAQYMSVYRYTPSGSPDLAFGVSQGANYKAATASGGYDDSGNALVIDSSGNIDISGYSAFATGLNPSNLVVWQFTSDGQFNPSFGSGGWVSALDTGAGSVGDYGYGITLDSTGNLVVSGDSRASACFCALWWRFLPDGTVDGTFGGISPDSVGATTEGTSQNNAGSPYVASNGDIYSAGFYANNWMGVWHLSPAGTVYGGVPYNVNASGFGAAATAMAVDTSGNLVVAGDSTDSGGNLHFWLWRLNQVSGAPPQLDTTFGGGTGSAGSLTTVVNSATGDAGNAIAVDSQNRYVIAGNVANGTTSLLVVWRFNSDGTPDTTFTDGSCTFSGVVGGCIAETTVAGAGGNANIPTQIQFDSVGRILVVGYSSGGANNYGVIWRIIP
jgi:uncharacterized delta-60 repeat protein